MNPEPMTPIRCFSCGRYLGSYRADFEARIEINCRCKVTVVIEHGRVAIEPRRKPPLTGAPRVSYP